MMSRELNGGFGGLFVTSEGALAVVLKDHAMRDEAISGLARMPLVMERQSKNPEGPFGLRNVTLIAGQFAYHELYEWYMQLLKDLPVTPSSGSIRVSQNRIVLGIPVEHRTEFDRTRSMLNIPAEAVSVVDPPRIHRASHRLTDKIRPITSALQVRFEVEHADSIATDYCVIGPTLTRLGQRGFLVPSHCTKVVGSVDLSDPTLYWQGVTTNENQIGNEAIDPPLMYGSAHCPPSHVDTGCRRSDAALALVRDNVTWTRGIIPRTTGRNDMSILISDLPPFEVTSTLGYSVEGEVLEKIGSVTGWSGGEVIEGCQDVFDEGLPGYWCQIVVKARVAQGDSGSPLFRISGGTAIQLRGMVWGMWGMNLTGTTITDARCGAYFPVGSVLGAECFLASPLGAIEFELDSSAAPLYFTREGGYGGGTGSGGTGGCVQDPVSGELVCET